MHQRHYQNREIKWCRYSDHARVRNVGTQKPWRIGRLLRTGYARVTSYSNGHPYAVVHWNGLKAPTQYHSDFIEVFATSSADPIPGIPELPIIEHLLRSKAWRA